MYTEPTQIDPVLIYEQVDRISKSKAFAAAARSQSFLRYVVEKSLANSAPKEYAIAVDVFERGSEYDPAIDATVRVEAGRLRSRLRDYYSNTGVEDPLIIDIPKGGYGAVFQLRKSHVNAAPSPTSIPDTQRDDLTALKAATEFDSSTPARQGDLGQARASAERSMIPTLSGLITNRLLRHILVALILAIAAGTMLKSLTGGRRVATSSTAEMHSSVLVSTAGRIQNVAFSPDGKEIAYDWDGENPGRWEIYVQLVGAEKPLRLTHTTTGLNCCISWSPNGRGIAYSHCDDQGGAVFMVPALGGAPRKLADLPCEAGLSAGWPVWSADGESLFLTNPCRPSGSTGIIKLSLATGHEECLSEAGAASSGGDERLTLSPDQKTLAFVRSSPSDHCDIYTLSLSSHAVHQLTFEGQAVRALMWSADGRNIIFRSSRAGVSQLWRVPAEGGPIERETTYPDVGSLSSDGRRVAFIKDQGSWPSIITEVLLSAPGGKIISTKDALASANLNDSPQLSPNGRQIIFESDTADDEGYGGNEIWEMERDGSDIHQLTSHGSGYGTPRWSPDGSKIAFDNSSTSYAEIMVMNADGRNPTAFVAGKSNNVVPSFSRDGRWIYFASDRTGRYEIWKKELASGREFQVTYRGGFSGQESPDGKMLYYSQIKGSGVWTVPVDGGEEQQLTDAPHLNYWGWFTVSNEGVYLMDTDQPDGAKIMFYSFRSHKLKPVFELQRTPLPWSANLTSSPDGRTLLFVLYKQTSSIVMVENFR